jgi:hypothetical protein
VGRRWTLNERGAVILCAIPPTDCDKRVWRSGIIEFCFRLVRVAARKSFSGQRLHLVAAAGVPSFGDIIGAFCRLRTSEVAGIAGGTARDGRQNGASFCFILFGMGNKSRFTTEFTEEFFRPLIGANER